MGVVTIGKQIRFFMLYSDEKQFFESVSELKDIIVNDKLQPVTVNELQNSNKTTFYIMSSESSIIKDKNGYINAIRSEVIEFSKCLIRNDKLVSYGRLWAEFEYFDDSEHRVIKSKRFKDKFVEYKKWITKNLKLSNSKDFYIGQEALKLYKFEGYKMMATPKLEVKFD